jgi:hypothetical protein
VVTVQASKHARTHASKPAVLCRAHLAERVECVHELQLSVAAQRDHLVHLLELQAVMDGDVHVHGHACRQQTGVGVYARVCV